MPCHTTTKVTLHVYSGGAASRLGAPDASRSSHVTCDKQAKKSTVFFIIRNILQVATQQAGALRLVVFGRSSIHHPFRRRRTVAQNRVVPTLYQYLESIKHTITWTVPTKEPDTTTTKRKQNGGTGQPASLCFTLERYTTLFSYTSV